MEQLTANNRRLEPMMRVEAKQLRGCVVPSWMLSMTMAVAFNAHALGLGEIQVNSSLGEPLNARVDLRELSYADAHDLRVRQASIEEYQNIGLQYPGGIRFNFQFVNEQGKQPFIDISTLRPIDEPFLTLLLEVSSASGKILRDYTFLLDPAPDLFVSARAVSSAAAAQQIGQAGTTSAAAEAAQGMVQPPVVRSTKHKKRKKRISGGVVPMPTEPVVRRAGEIPGESGGIRRPGGTLALSLSTSLSISRGEPGQPGAAPAMGDALQEELIAREKMLNELNAQISEIQAAIKNLQSKISRPAGAVVAESGVLAQSAAASSIPATTEAAAGKPKIPAPAATAPRAETKATSGLMVRFWSRVALVFALLIVAAGAVFWYRQRKFKQESGREIIEEAIDAGTATTPAEVVGAPGEVGEQPIKMPAYKGLKSVPVSSQEYDFLEQADIYLRFGHDKLAEDVLRKAININPINPHGYLTLLGIYETRGDAKSFYALAQQLKAIGNAADWRKVAEMGRKLDPNNPFYA